jgi:hypothetical protein
MNRFAASGWLGLGLLVACSRQPRPEKFQVRTLTITEAQRAPLLTVIDQLVERRVTEGAAVCITVHESLPHPGIAIMDSVTAGSVRPTRPLGYHDCPPTYGGMELVVVADGRPPVEPPRAPPGHRNPYHLTIRDRGYFLPDSARFEIDLFRTHITDFYRCAARRSADGWIAECRLVDSAIH